MTGWWGKLRAATSGLSVIEFAFIAPVLAALLLGILDFGRAYWTLIQVSNAADAGTQWVMQNGFDPSNPSAVTNVVTSATSLAIPTGNVGERQFCGCPATTGVQAYSCGAACPNGGTTQSYVSVSARVCFATIFHWPGLHYCAASDSNCGGCSAQQISLSGQSIVLQQ
jgi:Flp pilus assembly protein TadG